MSACFHALNSALAALFSAFLTDFKYVRLSVFSLGGGTVIAVIARHVTAMKTKNNMQIIGFIVQNAKLSSFFVFIVFSFKK